MRFTDMSGAEQNMDIEMFTPFSGIYKTNLIEQDKKFVGSGAKEFNLKIGKNSIETFRLEQ
jgi:hypothetical protein